MLIKRATIVQSGNDTVVRDVLIEDGKIKRIDIAIEAPENTQIIDAKEQLLIPGGVEVHAHFREPGFEEKETIQTGTQAAAKGGYTTVMPMPNLSPHPDNIQTIGKYLDLIQQSAVVNVVPYTCITKESAGEELVNMKAIKEEHKLRWFTDDGVGIQEESMMRQAMEQAKAADGMIIAHTEDMSYRKPGSAVHDGVWAKLRGWIGIPSETEYKQIERDLELSKETGAAYHICHMSAKESVESLRQAKAAGVDATGEVTIHHLLLTETDVKDTNGKMNPPLRTVEDRQALIDGLLDGTIDFLASDHAPHTLADKNTTMDEAAFGIVTIESAIPLFYTHFVKKERIDLETFQDLIAKKPAERFGLGKKGSIKEGYDADLVIISDEEKVIDPTKFASKGRNTPFAGHKCQGFPTTTIVGGKVVYSQEGVKNA